MARAAAIVLAFALIGVAATVLHARETRFPPAVVADRLLYLKSGKTADRLFLSFDALAADVYWIRTIQHYGRDYKDLTRPRRFELIDPLLDLTTTLDPRFLIAYRFGSVFLSQNPPFGVGRPDLAIKLLEKGLAADPNRWQLAHDIGFVHYFHTKDFAEAARWFERAMQMPNAPVWLGPLAAQTRTSGGDREGARQMLTALLDAPDEYSRREARRRLSQLDALDLIDRFEQAVTAYHTRHDRFPATWEDLIKAGFLPGVPVDPAGTPFFYDATTHRVVLSPQSPLSPLPQLLRRQ